MGDDRDSQDSPRGKRPRPARGARPERSPRVTSPIAKDDLDRLVRATSAPAWEEPPADQAVEIEDTPPGEMTPDEEFAAVGGSIQEALTSVTDQFATGPPPQTTAQSSGPADRRSPTVEAPAVEAQNQRPRPAPLDIHHNFRLGPLTPRATPATMAPIVGGWADSVDYGDREDIQSGVDTDTRGAVNPPRQEQPPAAAAPTTADGQVRSLLRMAHQLVDRKAIDAALGPCERALALDPENAEARQLLNEVRRARRPKQPRPPQGISSLDQVPQLRVPAREIAWHKLDHRTGFLLSQIDGEASYRQVLAICGMPRTDALDTLERLLNMGLIAPRTPASNP